MKYQKTVYTTTKHTVGETVLLVGRALIGCNEYYELYSGQYVETGYLAIGNKAICRYHGWRGCYDDCNVWAYGVRKIKSVTDTGKEESYGQPIYKVVVGPDLHPDWE